MAKQNCWDYMKCGREEGGAKAQDLGVCPAYKEKRLHGVHDGDNAGRSCWVIAGTYCGSRVQGTFAEKKRNCLECDFYAVVSKEEGIAGSFLMSPELMELLIK